MLAAINGESPVYNVLKTLHVLVVIVGFGVPMLSAIPFMAATKRGGREGLAIYDATTKMAQSARYASYAVFVFGIATLLASPEIGTGKGAEKLYSFKQAWVGASILLYFVAIGIDAVLLKKGSAELRSLMDEAAGAAPEKPAPAKVAEMDAIGKRLAMFGGIANLLVIVTLGLMVFKPGA